MKKVVAITALGIVAVLGGCTNGGDEEKCRQGGREAYQKLFKEEITRDETQKAVDDACRGLDASTRKTILDAEKENAIGEYLDSELLK